MTEQEKQDLIKELKRNFKCWKLAFKNLEKLMGSNDAQARDVAIYKSACMLKAMKEFVVSFNMEFEKDENT